jgi:hypothetical protein
MTVLALMQNQNFARYAARPRQQGALMRVAPFVAPSWLIILLLGLLLAGCGPKSLKERTRHGEKLSDESSTLLDEAERALGNLDPDRAEGPLRHAQKLLSHPDIELSPESGMLQSRLAELKARVGPAREEKARREFETAVDKQRDAIVQAMLDVSNAVEAIDRKDPSLEQHQALLDTIERTRNKLKEGKKLEAKSEDYAASVRRTEKRLEDASAKAQSAKVVIDFVYGPAANHLRAEELVKKAKAEKDPDQQLTFYTDARDRFQQCGETAKQLIAKTPILESRAIVVAGQTTTAKAVMSGCETRAGALQKTVTKLEKAKEAREKKKNARSKKG